MDNLNIVPAWIVGIITFLVFGGVLYYVPTITGNRLDLSEQEIQEMKAGIRRHGLQHYLRNGVFNTLLLLLAWLLAQLAVRPLGLNIFYLTMGTVLGLTNLYVSFRRMGILALESEMLQTSWYKIAFAILGIINLVMAIVGYLVG